MSKTPKELPEKDRARVAPKKVTPAEALDILSETEKKELAQRIGVLVRRKLGWVPPASMINRKLKRRIEAVFRSGDAHRIAAALTKKYGAIRKQINEASKREALKKLGWKQCDIDAELERSKSK